MMVIRCKEEGRRLRRTIGECLGLRMRTKLVGKTMWFKKRGGARKEGYGGRRKSNRKKTDETRGINTIPPYQSQSALWTKHQGKSWRQG